MNKITIPVILTATVLVAGIFAFMPIDEATTVHTTIGRTLSSDTLLFTTATEGAAVAADFTVEASGGDVKLTGLYIWWDDATLDEANNDSEDITLTTCSLTSGIGDDDIVYDTTDVVLGGDDNAGDIIEQDVWNTIDSPSDPDKANGIYIESSQGFACTMENDTDGTGTDGFQFTVVAYGEGIGTVSITSTDTNP